MDPLSEDRVDLKREMSGVIRELNVVATRDDVGIGARSANKLYSSLIPSSDPGPQRSVLLDEPLQRTKYFGPMCRFLDRREPHLPFQTAPADVWRGAQDIFCSSYHASRRGRVERLVRWTEWQGRLGDLDGSQEEGGFGGMQRLG